MAGNRKNDSYHNVFVFQTRRTVAGNVLMDIPKIKEV